MLTSKTRVLLPTFGARIPRGSKITSICPSGALGLPGGPGGTGPAGGGIGGDSAGFRGRSITTQVRTRRRVAGFSSASEEGGSKGGGRGGNGSFRRTSNTRTLPLPFSVSLLKEDG